MSQRSWKAIAICLGVISAVLVALLVAVWPASRPSSLRLLDPGSPGELRVWLEPYTLGTLLGIAGDPGPLPEGWLRCSGQVLQKSEYPRLFAAVGSARGDPTLSEDEFALPDLRGMYAVGVLPEAFPWPLRLLPMEYGYSSFQLGRGWKEIESLLDEDAPIRIAELVWVIKAR